MGEFRIFIERALESFRSERAIISRWQRVNIVESDSQQPRGAIERAVILVAGEDANLRRAGKPFALDIPSARFKQRVARSSKAGDVRHLAAGNKRETRRRRQSENFFQPPARNFFHHRGGGAGGVDRAILIPRSREPIRSERGRQRASDYPAEKSSTRGTDESAGSIAREFRDYVLGGHACLG